MILTTPQQRVLFFRTKLGWMGLGCQDDCVEKLVFGNKTRDEAAARMDLTRAQICKPNEKEQVWIDSLKAYAAGDQNSLAHIPLNLTSKTDFQLAVIQNCMEIPPGTTRSYGEVAELAGSPKAARAVGTVMKNNNTPLIVPCHRVVAASGLGGFNNPRGVSMKLKLLAHEGNQEFAQLLNAKSK